MIRERLARLLRAAADRLSPPRSNRIVEMLRRMVESDTAAPPQHKARQPIGPHPCVACDGGLLDLVMQLQVAGNGDVRRMLRFIARPPYITTMVGPLCAGHAAEAGYALDTRAM